MTAINDQTWEFIRAHADDDVRKVALLGTKSQEVDMTVVLQQIAGRQTARKKLPSWAAVDRIIYPPHLNMEQCSSEQTARYKASLLSGGHRYVDLTGGLGVDFYWMSQGYKERIYVERNEQLCAISTENFKTLGYDCQVCCCDTESFVAEMEEADVVYLDPARRNEHGGRTYDIRDCTPNIIDLMPVLCKKAHFIVIKLSPMLDWRKAVDDLQQVSQVHIVSVDNECKELLLVLEPGTAPLRLVCVNNEHIFEVPSPLISHPSSIIPHTSAIIPQPSYLYEPNASIMKAGCFTALEQCFPVRQVSANSHLFLSANNIDHFPGRRFEILAISSTNKREIKESLADIHQANITVRNFPMSVDQLRKKLHLKDGGDTYIFATTKADGAHCLYICRKIG